MEHTPGSWKLVLGGTDALIVFPDGGGIEVGDLIYHSRDTVPRARLIAAAPDLLAACEAWLEMVSSGDHNASSIDTLLRIEAMMGDAVDRARGGA